MERTLIGQGALLLVDDEPNVLHALHRELHGLPFRLLTASSGEEGLRIISSEDVRVVLSDYRMPGMSGVELLAEVRRQRPDAVRMVLSGYADFAALTDAINLGHIFKFIPKPWDAKLLREAIDAAFAYSDLVRRSAQFSRIFGGTGEGIVVVGIDGLIESANPASLAMFGYPAAELVGMRVDALLGPGQDSAQALAALRASRQWKGEIVARRQDGSGFDCEVVLTAIADSSGQVTQYVGLCADISSRKQIEAELERHRHHLEALVQERTADLQVAKQAAEAANRAKSIFLATISHELRTPMNGIMGMTQLVQRKVSEPRIAEQLAAVMDSARHLLNLINNLIDVAHLESKRLALEQQNFVVGDLRQSLEALLAPPADEKGLRLAIDLSTELAALQVSGDPVRLGQVIYHLADNALKFTAQGAVSIRGTVKDLAPGSASLSFEIEDTGPGIPEDEQRRLFQPFEQGDGSSTRRHGGMGVGLALCKELVTLMKGTIGVRSSPGSGTTFWFTVRLDRHPPTAAS